MQGFVKNVLDESNLEMRECMLQYLGNLMEDATDFSWQSSKASHVVLLCEMERGRVNLEDTTRLDRIRRAHAHKQNWVKNSDSSKKPWFCKFYQTSTCSFVWARVRLWDTQRKTATLPGEVRIRVKTRTM